jgi:hypothetical protein
LILIIIFEILPISAHAQNLEIISDAPGTFLSEKYGSISELGQVFELKLNQYVEFMDEKLTITFLDVLEDSRCPTDVTCVWQGMTSLSFNMSQVINAKFILNTLDKNTEIVFDKYQVELIDVKPYPISTTPIKNDDYIAMLRLSKITIIDTLSPKKQISQGIEPAAVKCSEGKILILKFSDNSPACVKLSTVDILYERGWGAMPPPCCNN